MTQFDFHSIIDMQRSIDRKYERIQALEEQAQSAAGIDPSKEKVKTSAVNRSMAIVDTLVDLKSDLIANSRRLESLKRRAEKLIRASDITDTERDVMLMRYVYALPWPAVAEILHYSISYIKSVHCDAIEKTVLHSTQ